MIWLGPFLFLLFTMIGLNTPKQSKVESSWLAPVLIGFCLLQASCGGGSNSTSTTPPPTPPPTPRGAPQWTLVGNTGFVQTWGLVFDNAGNMYAASNNALTGGI